jgi:hypothetical protein
MRGAEVMSIFALPAGMVRAPLINQSRAGGFPALRGNLMPGAGFPFDEQTETEAGHAGRTEPDE